MRQFGRIFLFVIVLTFFGPAIIAHAESASLIDASINITVFEDGNSQVRQTLSGDRAAGQKVRVPLVPNNANSLQLRTGESTDTTTVDITREDVNVLGIVQNLEFIDVDVPNTKNWQIELVYTDAHVLGSVGDYHFVELETFTPSFASEQINITFPLKEDLPASLGLKPDDSKITEGRQTYSFRTSGQREENILLTYGTDVTYSTTHTYEIKNSGWWWKDYQIVLPPDSNQQTVSVQSLSREPRYTRVDQDGNIVLSYRVGPKKTVTVEAEIITNVRALQYRLPETFVTPDGLDDYLNQIGAWTNGTSLESGSPKELVEQLTQIAVDDYSSGLSSTEVTNRLIANARVNNVPARFISGVFANSRLANDVNSMAVAHNWAELYFEGSGWMTLDATFAARYNSLSLVDALHIAQKVHGVSDVEPVSVQPVVTSIATTEEEVAVADLTPIQTKYLLLPGFSLTKSTVAANSGAVRDNTGFSEEDSPAVRLGSIAPLQEISFWQIDTGIASWTTNTIQAGLVTPDSNALNEILSVGESQISLVPMIVIVLVVGVGAVLLRRQMRKPDRIRLSEPDIVDDRDPEDLLDKSLRPEPVRIEASNY